MLRYFKRNIMLVVFAIIVSILVRLSIPVAALLEREMIDLITEGNLAEFSEMLLWAGGIILAAALLYLLNALTQKRFLVRFEESLRNDLYDGIMRQSHVRFMEKDTSEQMSFVRTHASTIANNFTQPVFVLISYGVMAIVVMGIMFYYSPLLTAVAGICALLSMILPLYFNKHLSKQLIAKLDKDAALTFQLKDNLNGHEAVAAFGVFPQIRQRFVKASQNLADADFKMQVTISLLENSSNLMQKFTWFIAFLLAGSMAVRGKITVGTLAMFITLFEEFNACVTLYAQTLPLLLSTRPDIQKMVAIIDDKNVDFNGRKIPTCENGISVRNLSFRYVKNVPVIEQLNFTIRKNEKIALIGASGCGKSTLIKLLSGNYAKYSGTICYDGVELHDLNIQELRKLVTVIHQNTFLFNDTIRFNICLGEIFSEESMQNALHLSGVDRFLPNIPNGLDGECGENGAQLSGGQKQRIALARALIRGVKVLILDEGVSAIDVETANEIEQELLNLKELTLLTITHRIKDGLTEQYDRVLILENGKLEERNRI